jgi:hypothetical protein
MLAAQGSAWVRREAAEEVAAEQAREPDVVRRASDLTQGHGECGIDLMA